MKIYTKKTCGECSKRIQQHKPTIQCDICRSDFHNKCAYLTPCDITELIESSRYDIWTCKTCYIDIFPFAQCDIDALPRINSISTLAG